MTSAIPQSMLKKLTLAAGRRLLRSTPIAAGFAGVVVFFAGCETPPAVSSAAAKSPAPAAAVKSAEMAIPEATPPVAGAGRISEIVTIREGDVLKISFPGAPSLDSSQQVRTDGVITLEIVGEVKVVGQSPKDLEKMLSKMYSTQLRSSEVTVAIVSSTFEIYITGAVLRPGKITTNKPITAFQAIMEAGYDPVNSNLEKVTLIRQVDRSKYSYIALNLQLVLEGKDTEPFYLRPSDTLQVPRKVSIF